MTLTNETDRWLQVIQVRESEGFVYMKYQGSRKGTRKMRPQGANLTEDRKKAYSGKLTRQVSKRMTKAISILVECSRKKRIYNPVLRKMIFHRLSFITLTIHSPERNIEAKEAYQTCLKPLLQFLHKYRGMKMYVWKAEKQKRGQIHYHLVTPLFINKSELSEKWNNLQSKAGYLDQYFEVHRHINAPSTQIHSVKNISKINKYLAAYLTSQKHDHEGVGGKMWDCSYNLKIAKYFETEPDYQTEKNIKEGIKKGEIAVVELERVTCIKCFQYPLKLYLSKTLYDKYNQHYAAIRDLPVFKPATEPDT